MSNKLKFLGHYESNAGLPDGSVALVQPGEVISYDGDLPEDSEQLGLWEVTRSKVTETETPDEIPAVPAPVDPADDPENSAPPLALPENLTPSHIPAEPAPAADPAV